MAEEKKAFRINVVDILITFMIIAVLTVGIMMLANAFDVNAFDEGISTVEYTVQFKKVRAEFSDNIKVGDAVIDSQKRHNLGTVTAVESMIYDVEIYDEETKTRTVAQNPDFITIEMDVIADVYVSGQMCYLKDSGKEIGIGTALYIHLPDFCSTGYISAMNIIE